MSEKKPETKGKKTLSLKLGSKPVIPQSRGIEVGKTVIVEKKRVKRNSESLKKSSEKTSVNSENTQFTFKDTSEIDQTQKKKRSKQLIKYADLSRTKTKNLPLQSKKKIKMILKLQNT